MTNVNVVRRNLFRDSLQLMRLSEEAKKLAGVDEAVVAMGTETNKRLLEDLHLLGTEGKEAGEGDLILAVRVKPGTDWEAVVKTIEQMLMSPPHAQGVGKASAFHSVDSALVEVPGVNLALVSVPGGQAFEPSMQLLRRSVNVHLFSDHVPRDQELELKKFANSRGLLVLGPGAGTSIISGTGLGFANAVRRGGVGIVASAGTGIQEVSVLLDRAGLGVSHALGVGGSDVSEEVGGMMMKDCLGLLEDDASTQSVIMVAKAPSDRVMHDVMEHVERRTTKPVVACFLGLDSPTHGASRIAYGKTLHSAASRACTLAGPSAGEGFAKEVSMSFERLEDTSKRLAAGLSPRQKNIRALYSGGTLAHETLLIFRELLVEPYSNTPLTNRFLLEDPSLSKENSVVDMGDEYFTAGRAHPMIDSTLRRLRILQEARDASVGVVLLDAVLGYGAASDPAGALKGAIEEAKSEAGKRGEDLAVLAHVCGTDKDPQSLKEQSRKLADAGAVLFASNALMAAASALVVGGPEASEKLRVKWSDLLG